MNRLTSGSEIGSECKQWTGQSSKGSTSGLERLHSGRDPVNSSAGHLRVREPETDIVFSLSCSAASGTLYEG